MAMPPGVETAAGDLDHPSTLAPALIGIGAVFLIPGFADMPGLLAEIRKAGAQRVVLLSGGSAASGDMGNAVSAYMVRSESAVIESGLRWTILRPTSFMSNALRWIPQLWVGDTVRVPFATTRTATVDPLDIAACAAQALQEDGHEGRVYRLTGPDSLRPADQIGIMARVLGRQLHCESQPDDEARAEMSKNMPTEYVDAFFDFYAAGSLDESEVLPTVVEITGREPRTFEEWVQAHAQTFRAATTVGGGPCG